MKSKKPFLLKNSPDSTEWYFFFFTAIKQSWWSIIMAGLHYFVCFFCFSKFSATNIMTSVIWKKVSTFSQRNKTKMAVNPEYVKKHPCKCQVDLRFSLGGWRCFGAEKSWRISPNRNWTKCYWIVHFTIVNFKTMNVLRAIALLIFKWLSHVLQTLPQFTKKRK